MYACSYLGQRPTWAGCGKHIETALADVPVDQRCQCPRAGASAAPAAPAAGAAPAAANTQGPASK